MSYSFSVYHNSSDGRIDYFEDRTRRSLPTFLRSLWIPKKRGVGESDVLIVLSPLTSNIVSELFKEFVREIAKRPKAHGSSILPIYIDLAKITYPYFKEINKPKPDDSINLLSFSLEWDDLRRVENLIQNKELLLFIDHLDRANRTIRNLIINLLKKKNIRAILTYAIPLNISEKKQKHVFAENILAELTIPFRTIQIVEHIEEFRDELITDNFVKLQKLSSEEREMLVTLAIKQLKLQAGNEIDIYQIDKPKLVADRLCQFVIYIEKWNTYIFKEPWFADIILADRFVTDLKHGNKDDSIFKDCKINDNISTLACELIEKDTDMETLKKMVIEWCQFTNEPDNTMHWNSINIATKNSSFVDYMLDRISKDFKEEKNKFLIWAVGQMVSQLGEINFGIKKKVNNVLKDVIASSKDEHYSAFNIWNACFSLAKIEDVQTHHKLGVCMVKDAFSLVKFDKDWEQKFYDKRYIAAILKSDTPSCDEPSRDDLKSLIENIAASESGFKDTTHCEPKYDEQSKEARYNALWLIGELGDKWWNDKARLCDILINALNNTDKETERYKKYIAIKNVAAESLELLGFVNDNHLNNMKNHLKDLPESPQKKLKKAIKVVVQQHVEYLVNAIIDAIKNNRFPSDNLIEDTDNYEQPNQVVMLIKPPLLTNPVDPVVKDTLTELLTRIYNFDYTIKAIRVFDWNIKEQFNNTYWLTHAIAEQDDPWSELTPEEQEKVKKIYGTTDFRYLFGHELTFGKDRGSIKSAMNIKDAHGQKISNEIITCLWETGRDLRYFRNEKANGLNKIGRHKSVFPVTIAGVNDDLPFLLLNGFYPSLQNLFTSEGHYTVAVQIQGTRSWEDLRKKFLGQDSDPWGCELGSIRRDAIEGILPLPKDIEVNGQKNIAHMGQNPLESLWDMHIWFDIRLSECLIGKKILKLAKTEPHLRGKVRDDVNWESLLEKLCKDTDILDILSKNSNLSTDDTAHRIIEYLITQFNRTNERYKSFLNNNLFRQQIHDEVNDHEHDN